MKAYLNPYFGWLLWWSLWASAWECTRCGGHHPLSQCRWPVVEQEGGGDA